jgi:glycosyltransferase involved in cell wall biosynthesis
VKKILHRIFFNFDNSIDPFLPYLETWKKELPDFEIMQWDKSNLPLDLNKYTKYMAETKNHAFLSDYFRCWLLTEYGGAYLDADIEILDGDIFRKIYEDAQKSNDYVLFIGIENKRNGGLTPHSMGVKCGETHELLQFLINIYETIFTTSMRHIIKKFPIPDLMSLFFWDSEEIEHFSLTKKGCFFNYNAPFIAKKIKIYTQDYFSPVTAYNNRMTISAFSENTCLCHHFAATWKNNQSLSNGILFSDLLKNNYYTIDPKLISLLRRRYELPKHIDRPLWSLNENEIRFLEKGFNKLFPYGGVLHSFLRHLRSEN